MQHVIDSSSEVNNCCQPRGSRATRCAPWNTTLSPLTPARAFPNSGDGSVARYTWYIHFLWVYKYSFVLHNGAVFACSHTCLQITTQVMGWPEGHSVFWCSVGFSFFVFSTVLCADRVGQMTKTYNDIDAVTRLLEEVRYFNFASSMRVNWSFSFFNQTKW